MERFWITTARWGHIPFLVLWFFAMSHLVADPAVPYVMISVMAVSFSILVLIKVLVHAPRPFLAEHRKAPFWVPKHDSFPSGHAWLLATGTVMLFTVHGPMVIAMAVCVLGILVSYARFRSGVHRISEVLFGYLGGLAISILAFVALGTLVL